jgi:hypothetical protein
VDRHVGSAFEQGPVELAGPQFLAADLGERAVARHVAARCDRHDLEMLGPPAVRVPQGRGDQAGLNEGERRTAGSDAQGAQHAGLC